MALHLFTASRRARRFEEQVRPLLGDMYRYAHHLTRSPEDAEDLVQDVLCRLYAGETPIENLDNPRTWLAKVLYRQFVDSRRKASRTPTLLSDENADEILPTLAHDKPSPEELCEQAQRQEALDRALAQLNEDHRIVILLHDVEGFALEEIEEMLDTPIGTLKSRLHRGRQRLRDLFFGEREPSAVSERVIG